MKLDQLNWYALRVEPQREYAAESILTKVGVKCFVPTEARYPRINRHRRRATDKKAEPKLYPFFRGYLFAGFPGFAPMFELARFRVVTGVVGFGGMPYVLPHDAVEHLVGLSGRSIPRRSTPNPHKSFDVGETVEITGGPFEGHVLPIVGISGDMAEFFVQFLGKEQKVHLPLSILEAA